MTKKNSRLPTSAQITLLEKLSSLLNNRFLLAFDSEGCHVRQTLCVTHHAESGEVQYESKPIISGKIIDEAIMKAIKHLSR